jgi:glycosyltransferase involved in cell wall biosynthesis
MTRARVSAVIPVFNGAAFLADALASIRAQDSTPDEIVVVDDGSTDGSAELASRVDGVRVVAHERNRGLPAARNTGIAAAAGDVIAFLDADDLWVAAKTRVQLEFLKRDPGAGIVVGHTQRTRLVTHPDGTAGFEPWAEPELALSLGAALVRRRIFEVIGDFDEALPFTNDWDWFFRAREQGVGITVHPDVVQYYRRHDTNMTGAIEDGNRYTLLMLRKSLQRRRDAGGAAESLPPIGAD